MPMKLKSIIKSGEIHFGIGMRNIKTSVAVIICLLLYEVIYRIAAYAGITMQYSIPMYACTTAIICMQGTTQETLAGGFARMIGTLYGGILGFMALFLSTYTSSFITILIIGLAISLSIFLCNVTGQQQASAICCVVLLAMVYREGEGSQYGYALYRLAETMAGVVIAALVNRYFFIPQWVKSLKSFLIAKMDRIKRKMKQKSKK